MNIDLIVSDVDGTLIDVDESLTSDFYMLTDIVKNQNIPFTIASGRCYDDLLDFIKEFDIDMPVVVNNGAGCVQNGKLLWDNKMSYRLIKDAIQFADSLDMVIITSDGLSDRAYRHNAYIQNQIDKFGRYDKFYRPEKEEDWENFNVQKLLIIDPQKPGRIDGVLEYLKPYEDELNIVRYNDRSVDIMSKQSNKAQGIINVSKILEKNIDNIMAVGDARNDIEMIKSVGFGVAVCNANVSLKEVAHYVCENNNASGVLEAVNKFYFK